MKPRILPAAPLVLCLLLAACPHPFAAGGPVLVRFENESTVPLDSVDTAFVDDVGTLAPGEATEYVEVERAYRYTYFAAVADGRRVVLQPIDYVGETPLGGGRYTYVVLYDPPTGDLGMRLRVDG